MLKKRQKLPPQLKRRKKNERMKKTKEGLIVKSNIFKKLIGVLNVVVMGLIIQSATSTCIWVLHQPKFPEEAEQIRRIKRDTEGC